MGQDGTFLIPYMTSKTSFVRISIFSISGNTINHFGKKNRVVFSSWNLQVRLALK